MSTIEEHGKRNVGRMPHQIIYNFLSNTFVSVLRKKIYNLQRKNTHVEIQFMVKKLLYNLFLTNGWFSCNFGSKGLNSLNT